MQLYFISLYHFISLYLLACSGHALIQSHVIGRSSPSLTVSVYICFHISGSCLAENGALKVNKHLQVEGFDNVYAVGDCANISEPKLAYHAGLHAGVAATNIINSLSGKALTSYQTGTNHKTIGFAFKGVLL